MREYPTYRTKESQVPISELILHQRTTYNKPIFLLVTNKYNLARYEACYNKFYKKQAIHFGDCTAGYLVHYLPEAKDQIYNTFSLFAVEAAQGAVWDQQAKRLANLQYKQENKYKQQVTNQEYIMQDADPDTKQLPEQESGNMTGKGIQQEEQ